MQIRWGGCYSLLFSVTNVVRQGNERLMLFRQSNVFAVYMNNLSKELIKMKVGCFVGKSIINYLFFADDLGCFCPRIHGLQRIIQYRYQYLLFQLRHKKHSEVGNL